MKKVVVITGASSGIGLETANYFADKGYKVYGISRADFNTSKFKHICCDICDHNKVEQVFDQIVAEAGKIDILVNNAGIGISGAIEFLDFEYVKKIFDVNVLALMNCCKTSLKYLRKSQGRIINISSVASIFAIPFQACYSATKSAVESFSLALANEVKDQRIKVVCVRPGDTKTGFTAARQKTETTNEVYGSKINKSVAKMERDEQKGMPPIKVAQVVFKVATQKNPPLVKTVGFAYKTLSLLSRLLPTKLVNYIVGKLY